jgi:hypothetical protein
LNWQNKTTCPISIETGLSISTRARSSDQALRGKSIYDFVQDWQNSRLVGDSRYGNATQRSLSFISQYAANSCQGDAHFSESAGTPRPTRCAKTENSSTGHNVTDQLSNLLVLHAQSTESKQPWGIDIRRVDLMGSQSQQVARRRNTRTFIDYNMH